MEVKKVREKKREERCFFKAVFLIAFVLVFLILFSLVASANPAGIDQVVQVSNVTKSSASAAVINISGGYIDTFNITARIQDPRWKGFVGNVTGSFALDDASGSTLYDWELSSLTGRVYTTRNSITPNWASIECSNITTLNSEANALNLTNPSDTLNKTFNSSGVHSSFYVGAVFIAANSCPVLNTFVNSASQTSSFQEVALYSPSDIIYATLLEQGTVGYNGQHYDFQEIVPENGTPGFNGATAYYLYIELGS